jgi:NodT family efflux transporter outer membrane factor (OMF) lipoprotein
MRTVPYGQYEAILLREHSGEFLQPAGVMKPSPLRAREARPVAHRRLRGFDFGWAGLALLAGCAVGPDFTAPKAPDVDRYTPETLAPETGSAPVKEGAAQRFVLDKDIPVGWWKVYRSEALDRLVDEALQRSPTLDAAKASLRQAQANLYATEGGLYPSLTGNVSATREKISGASFGFPGLNSIFSVGTAQLNVSYALDVFGGTRRGIEASAAQADYQRFQLAAAYVSLTSNVVAAAVQEASLRAQIAANQQIVTIEADELKVLRQQLQLGGVAGGAVLAQEATLAQARAALPPLQKQLAQSRNQLATLAGRFPSEDVGATFELKQLTLPADLPLSLPSKLVAQRPDVRAAEATLHQTSAEIGVAVANELPQISLTGSFGNTGTPAGSLLNPGTGIWSIGGSLAQTIFDGGTLWYKRKAAVAAFDAAAAQYRGTVLQAFQDVANALRALQSDADALIADVAAEQAASKSLDLSQEQYRDGAIPYTTLLQAEQTLQQARVSLAQAEAARFADTAALFQALGGGWWNDSGDALDPDKHGPTEDAAVTKGNAS